MVTRNDVFALGGASDRDARMPFDFREQGAMPHLAYRDDTGNIVHIDLKEKELVIGREADCDLILTSKAVSRHHAKIVHDGARWRLVDTGSLHGTFLNRVR